MKLSDLFEFLRVNAPLRVDVSKILFKTIFFWKSLFRFSDFKRLNLLFRNC